MSAPSVSVVVVSRHRPDSLAFCLTGLSRLIYPAYEIIVVADPGGLAAVQDLGLADEVKLVPFDQPNISRARNLGIEAAAGDVVAFIDDDAVPEPLWLHHLTGVFDDPQVAAAGGFVRGRNGISFQWKARSVDPTGVAHPLAVDEQNPTLPSPPNGHAIKTEGTNMAVRRRVLQDIGGFDPAFRFYLDETDLNMRLAQAGLKTAIVPLAQVHHAYAPSPRRRQNRAVVDLFDVGASSVHFLRRHCPPADHPRRLEDLRREQSFRLQGQLRDGRLDVEAMHQALRSLEAGIADAQHSGPQEPGLGANHNGPFLPFASRTRQPHQVLAGRSWQRRKLLRKAAHLAQQGHSVSVFVFSFTALFHKVRYCESGIWYQTGGVFGRSDRQQRLFRLWRFAARLHHEIERVSRVRMH